MNVDIIRINRSLLYNPNGTTNELEFYISTAMDIWNKAELDKKKLLFVNQEDKN